MDGLLERPGEVWDGEDDRDGIWCGIKASGMVDQLIALTSNDEINGAEK